MNIKPEQITLIVQGQFKNNNWSNYRPYAKSGFKLKLLTSEEYDLTAPDYFEHHTYTDALSRNKLIKQIFDEAKTKWLFLLHEFETFSIEKLIDSLGQATPDYNFVEMAIKNKWSDGLKIHHKFEIRGVRNRDAALQTLRVQGKLWPVLHQLDRNQILAESFVITRTKPVNQCIIWPDLENLNIDSWDFEDLLWLGFYALDQQNPDLAEQIFLKVNKSELDALRFRPAWLNGLAQVAFMQQKWDKTEELLSKSLALNEQQQLPHIIRFNIASKHMHWEKAYQHLYTYLQVLAEGSRINHDVMMPLDQTHQLLAETAYHAGQHERAYAHYQELYRIQSETKQEISNSTIERLLLYSIELDEKKEAVSYFHHLYDPIIDRELSDDEWKEVDRRIQLFAGNEWFDFVVEMYEEVFAKNTDRPEALRRLVAALIKNGQIDRAQALIRKHKTVIS